MSKAKIIKTGRRYPYCSECNANLERPYYRFCPWCGANFEEPEQSYKSIELQDGQDGYEAVAEYIDRYWRRHDNYSDTVVVNMEISYDNKNYEHYLEIASPDGCAGGVEFLTDWWEGQEHIRVLGIKYVRDLDVLGGIQDEQKQHIKPDIEL